MRAGHDADRDRAVATDDEGDLARNRGRFDTIRDRSRDLHGERDVLRPPVFRVRARHDLRKVTVVDHGASAGVESLHETGRAKRRDRLLLPGRMCTGTGLHTKQSKHDRRSLHGLVAPRDRASSSRPIDSLVVFTPF